MLLSTSDKTLTLNDKHEYYDENKIKIPGVTNVLREMGLIDTEYMRAPAGGDNPLMRGNFAHKTTQYLDEGTLDESTVHPRLAGYLESYRKGKKLLGLKFKLIECKIYHSVYRYAGKLDRLDEDYRLIDLKTGDIKDWTALQLAAYELCVKEEKKYRNKNIVRMAMQLMPDGSNPNIKTFKDRNDGKVFLGLLAGYNWKKNHNYQTEKWKGANNGQ